MRAEVLAGIGQGAQAAFVTDLYPLIDRFLRQAQTELWNRFSWLQNRTEITIPLIQGTKTYDLPDTYTPGGLSNVSVRTADGLREWALAEGITPEDRENAVLGGTLAYVPTKFDIQGGVINLLEAPGTNVATLVLAMDSGPVPLVAENERPAVDSEACVQYGTILTREHMGMPLGNAEARMLNYVNMLQGSNAERTTTAIGGGYMDSMQLRQLMQRQNRSQRGWWIRDVRP